jgi:type VI secretion system protein ImpG
MSTDLLRYYNEELRFLRQQGTEFAAQHPQVANRLSLDEEAESIRDPHVERLIQGVALLNARTRLKIDDDFPQVSEALLNLVAPQYVAPIPPMAIVEARLPPAAWELVQGAHLERGSRLESAALPDGEPLRFQSVYPLSAWPMSVTAASLEHRPFASPEVPAARSAAAVVRIRLESFQPAMPLGQIGATSLRFYLNAQPPYVYDLYELLRNHLQAVTIAPPNSRYTTSLNPKDCTRPIGFERHEAALPDSARALPGHSLLAEFFAFPQKFLFLELDLPAAVWKEQGPVAEILFYLDHASPDLAPSIAASTFRLGCTPVINLYEQTAEPITIDHLESEYRVVPDARRPLVHEIYRIERVTGTSSSGRTRVFDPMYSFQRTENRDAQPAYWVTTRRAAGGNEQVTGSDLFMSLVDLDFRPAEDAADQTLKVDTVCMTRDYQRLKNFEGGLPRLQPKDQQDSVIEIECITRPTPVLRPVMGRGTRWRLLSHLSLNGLSLKDLAEGSELGAGADGLRELLRLYNLRDDKRNSEIIAGLVGVDFKRATGRIAEMINGRRHEFITRGSHVTLHFDESRLTGGGVFLFASVLDRFLGGYCTLNSFVQTTAVTRQRGPLVTWPKRAGDHVLI